jgi:nucleotide-binding universal stress UspA family protein
MHAVVRHAPVHPVIVGYSGSASSRNALAYASGLARRLGRPLLLIHVTVTTNYCVPASSGLLSLFDPEQFERWLLAEFDEVTEPRGIEVHARARSGSPARELAAACVEYSADALVIGRSAPFRRYVAGSKSAWLVNRADCPVIVVP